MLATLVAIAVLNAGPARMQDGDALVAFTNDARTELTRLHEEEAWVFHDMRE